LKNFAKIQNKASAFMDKLLGSGLETTIIYKMFVSTSYDDSTGMNETTYQNYEIKAVKVDASLQANLTSSIMSGISFGSGEVIYLIKHSDFPRTNVYDPNVLKDFVSDNSEEKQVKTAVPLVKTFIKV